MLNGFLSEKTEQVQFQFSSAVTHSGEEEIKWLMGKYLELMERMEIPYVLHQEEKQIVAEGHHLHQIFQQEAGIHLFYVSHRVPVPILLDIKQEGSKAHSAEMQVIRIYDGMETLTDIRTGFSNTMNLTADEFKLLLYGGM